MKKKYETPELEFDSFDLSEYICRELYGDFYAAGAKSGVQAAGAGESHTTTTTLPPGGHGEGGMGDGEGGDPFGGG